MASARLTEHVGQDVVVVLTEAGHGRMGGAGIFEKWIGKPAYRRGPTPGWSHSTMKPRAAEVRVLDDVPVRHGRERGDTGGLQRWVSSSLS